MDAAAKCEQQHVTCCGTGVRVVLSAEEDEWLLEDLLALQDTVKPLLILSPGDVQAWLGQVGLSGATCSRMAPQWRAAAAIQASAKERAFRRRGAAAAGESCQMRLKSHQVESMGPQLHDSCDPCPRA